ncbi:MAG: molybdopterin-dependent oxidoreductase [Myxococcales bacterium]|nr:molybdopterin-dependent oxidoreductase [Myxococcales bacterium]
MLRTERTFCRICEALCGLEISLDGNQITEIRPDPEHVATKGFACVKGLKQQRLYGSPDRLEYPLKRVGDRHERVSWEQALSEIGAKVRRLRQASGPDSIAMYVGTAAGFGVLHPVFAQGFMNAVGSRNMYSSATQDCANKFAVARLMYGFPFTQPFPDVDRVRCLIVVGANPAVSKWSFLQVSNPIQRLRAIEARGGRVFFVDPRRTESTKVAGEHVFIRPNTDVFFYLAFLNHLLRLDAISAERISEHTTGFDAVRRLVEPWTPERCAEVTQIPADVLREMVKAYSEADGAALYLSTGVNMGSHGSIAFWLQEVINLVSGNLDRRGGTLVGRGIVDFARFARRTGVLLRSDRSRVGGFQAVNDGFPGGTLADEILTPGAGQVKALFVTGGNPLITMANSGRLREAFEALELLVTLDIQPSETARLSHYVLPCTSPLQRPDLPFVFPLLLGMQSRPYLQATRAVLPPSGEQRDEASIYLALARAAGLGIFGSKVAQLGLEALQAWHSRKRPDAQHALPQELLLSLLLRVTGQGSFEQLLAAPHGRLRPDHRGNTFLGKRVVTDDGRVSLAPPELVRQAQQLEEFFAAEKRDARRLKLITKRAVTTHNSWTHNLDEFVAGERATNYLYLHPEDAARLDLKEGDLADVRTQVASVRVPVRLTSDLMPGTVALPHGWGHQQSGLSVARQTRGVNVNLLAHDGPERLEKVSGMAHLTGFAVDVRRAADPRRHNWSGS